MPVVFTVTNFKFWGICLVNISVRMVQFGAWPELISVTVTALGGIPKELMNHRNRSQLQFLNSMELINHGSYRITQSLRTLPY